MTTDIKIERIRKIDRVIELWPFFREGLEYINKLVREEKKLPAEKFFSVIIDAVAMGDDRGHVAVYSEDGKTPVGFTITFGSSSKYDLLPTAVVYAAYSKRTIIGATRFCLSHVEKWARSKGYKELQAFTPRINGRGFALFEKRFGFKRYLMLFSKIL
jgi:GNAT superfamily N-acetyltransferase